MADLKFEDYVGDWLNAPVVEAGVLLDRITRHVHILEVNGVSYRLMQSHAYPPIETLPSNALRGRWADSAMLQRANVIRQPSGPHLGLRVEKKWDSR